METPAKEARDSRCEGLARLALGQSGLHHGGHLALKQAAGPRNALTRGIFIQAYQGRHLAGGLIFPVVKYERYAELLRELLQGLIHHSLLFPLNRRLDRESDGGRLR